MLLLRALLLWMLVSVHVVGGAVLFRRLFPRESPWLGFFVPAIAFCIALNFIEHFIPLPSLLWLLPFTTLGSILLLVRSGPVTIWSDLRLPTVIFLGSFAFTFMVRCIEPSVLASSDGLADLNLIANFCKGETLPPTDGWLPPFKLEYYYTFQHYAASVIVRLLDVDIGTGYNLAHALLCAFIAFVASAVAWRLTQRAWITLLMPLLILGAATGSSAYLLLTESNPTPWIMSNLTGGLEHPDKNPIWKLLASDPYRERLELQVPGFWTWRDEYHPNAGGHLLALCAVWMLVELLRKERTNWPWIGAVLVPFLAIITSTWALPIIGILCGGGLVATWWTKQRPLNTTFVWSATIVGLIGIWPTLMPLFSSPYSPPVMWNHSEWRTPLYEFLIQWWPVIVLWAALLPNWRKLLVAVKWAHIVVPLMLIGIECVNIEDGRYNTIEKMWGYTFGVGLVALFPAVALRRGIIPRLVTGLVVSSSVIALYGWVRGSVQWADWRHNAFHLEGNGILRLDPQRAQLLQEVSQLRNATILTGKVIWDYNDSPALATFSGNRTYTAWTWSEFHYGHGGESDLRERQVNDFYAGKIDDPLTFLQAHGIAAVVIWPDDQIPNDLLATLKQKLTSRYNYVDCRSGSDQNAGVFLLQPEMAGEAMKPAR